MGRGRPFGRTAIRLAAAVVALALAAAEAGAQPALEYGVKANYLVRFAAFVEWPAAALGPPASPLVICVVGPDPFGRALDDAVAGQQVDGRPVTVRRIARLGRDAGCHIAYIGRPAGQSAAAALASVQGQPVLTVTDQAMGGNRGMVHFAVADRRVRFHIDRGGAGRAGLNVSSRLLALALSVREGD